MKIGMILDNLFPPDARVGNEASELIRNGHQVYLFCLTYDRSGLIEYEQYDGIHITRKFYPKIIRRIAALAYSNFLYHIILLRSVIRFIHSNEVDALHVHDMQLARTVFWANRLFGLPLVLDLHENRPEIMKHYPHVLSFLGKIMINPSKWEEYESKFIEKSSKTVVVTEEARQYYMRKLGLKKEHFIVAPNTVTSSFFTSYSLVEEIVDKYSTRFMVLYIGDTGIRRGIMTIVEAVHLLKDIIPGLVFVLIGKSKDDKFLKKYIEDLEAGPWIEFLGWKDPSLFQSYILASKICISPLLRNIHHDTTYANKLFQYISMGRPVLVSNCSAQANIVSEVNCGMVHEAGNANDFSEKIRLMYDDPAGREKMGIDGKKFVEHEFTWEKTSFELVNIYDELESSVDNKK